MPLALNNPRKFICYETETEIIRKYVVLLDEYLKYVRFLVSPIDQLIDVNVISTVPGIFDA